MNKKSIVHNHIKKINEARKIGKKGCYSCIFNMSNRELSSALDIEEDDGLAPCPLTAYVLFIYGFINSCTYDHAVGNLVQEHLISNQNIAQRFDLLNKKQKNYIITDLQKRYVDCGIGCSQECHIIEVNKI